jgi:hypothetical protein
VASNVFDDPLPDEVNRLERRYRAVIDDELIAVRWIDHLSVPTPTLKLKPEKLAWTGAW